MHSHPERHPTPILPRDTVALIVTERTRKSVAQAAWLTLKSRQILEDGTDARIEGERRSRLETMASHWPASPPPTRTGHAGIDPAPGIAIPEAAMAVMVDMDDIPDLRPTPRADSDESRIAAHPAVRRAVDSLRGARSRAGFLRVPPCAIHADGGGAA